MNELEDREDCSACRRVSQAAGYEAACANHYAYVPKETLDRARRENDEHREDPPRVQRSFLDDLK